MSVGNAFEARYEDGFSYHGHFDLDYLRSGVGILKDNKGRLCYSGFWCGDCRHGRGTEYLDGVVMSGKFQMDRLEEGLLNFTHTGDSYKGQICFEAEIISELPHGWGTYTYSNGDIFRGMFSEGERHGLGRLQCANGDEHSGCYSHNLPHGYGQCQLFQLPYPSSSVSSSSSVESVGIYDGEFKGGRRCGIGIMTLPANSALSLAIAESLQIACHCLNVTYKGSWRGDLPEGLGEMFAYDEQGGLLDGCAGIWQAGVLVEQKQAYSIFNSSSYTTTIGSKGCPHVRRDSLAGEESKEQLPKVL